MKRYADFELWINSPTAPNAAGYPSANPVHVTVSPAGPASGIMELDVTDQGFQHELSVVRDMGPDLPSRQAFGQRLFEALFRNRVRDAWMTSRGRVDAGEADGLRLRLWIDDPQLAALPWELMHEDGKGFLATAANLALSRFLPVPEPPAFAIQEKMRILVIVESPSNLPPIQPREIAKLKNALSSLNSSVEHKVLRNPTKHEIQNALQDGYHVLHFLGHGLAGKLALTKEGGTEAAYLTDQEFAQLIQGRASSLRLVVLNACYSSQPADGDLFAGMGPWLVKMQLPAVVAMQYNAISMDTASQFSRAFYGALANEIPVDFAVNEARQQISAGELLQQRDWTTPVLYMGTRQGRVWSIGKDSPPDIRWSRAMVRLSLEDEVLDELGAKVRTMRELAQGKFSELLSKRHPPEHADPEHVRVTVFLPENRRNRVQDGDVCSLYIPPKCHEGIGRNSAEREIKFRTNEGLTGSVYTAQRPLGARREANDGEWKRIEYEGGTQNGYRTFELTDAQKAIVNKGLTWIVSVPLKASEDGETLGVLNIDGLTDALSNDEMWEMYDALRGQVAEFAADLDRLPKCRVTISVSNL